MRAWVLGSGSRGNAILFEDGDTRVLLDAGFPPRALANRLRPTGVPPESIDAVVVTHEHVDHIRGVARGAARWGWKVFATRGTLAGERPVPCPHTETITPGVPFSVGTITIEPIRVPHDAREPIAIRLTTAAGTRVGVAYDLGFATQGLQESFSGAELLMLEANHDEGMLRAGPYAPWLQERIAGPTGHLSNRAAATFAQACATANTRSVVLMHLSETNNDPGLAVGAVGRSLGRGGYAGTLQAATQDAPLGPIEV